MIRKSAHILRALGLALVVSAGSAHADGLAQLKQFMDGTRTARGTFSQQVYSKSGRKPQQASGTFAFSRPMKKKAATCSAAAKAAGRAARPIRSTIRPWKSSSRPVGHRFRWCSVTCASATTGPRA